MSQTKFYDWPKYYEVAFSFRDIPREAKFIRDCIKRYSTIPVERVLEIGCGPAPHAGELQSLGYKYAGIDINPRMLAHAENKWQHLNPRPELLESDMTSFEGIDLADFAYILLGSLYLRSIDEMNSHFDSIAHALKPGALYFLDGCIQFIDPLRHVHDNAYTIEKDGITVSSEFTIELVDSDRQMYEEIWTVNVDDHGLKKTFEMVEHNKSIEPTEFVGFISQRPDFELVGWWQDWNFDRPILQASEVTRPIALVRRVAPNDY